VLNAYAFPGHGLLINDGQLLQIKEDTGKPYVSAQILTSITYTNTSRCPGLKFEPSSSGTL